MRRFVVPGWLAVQNKQKLKAKRGGQDNIYRSTEKEKN